MAVKAHPCLNCKKVIFDDGHGKYIYRVTDDTFICSVQCEKELMRKGE